MSRTCNKCLPIDKYREYSHIFNSIFGVYGSCGTVSGVMNAADVTASEMLLGDAKIIADNIESVCTANLVSHYLQVYRSIRYLQR